MNAFDKVIGYDNIKAEMAQIADMLKNRERYENMGARMPRGVLMYGDPGLGKTLVANAFIRESGLPCRTVRRKDSGPDFIKEIASAFAEAREKAPFIVFLDDMDKFSNEDEYHRDAEEYVTVQSCIDECAGSDVFVLATVNDMRKLPRSLKRAGRFDLKIHFTRPAGEDAEKIIRYYLSGKKIAQDVDFNDLYKMMSYSSCSELETILNDAAIRAASANKTAVETEDLVASVLTLQYHISAGRSAGGARKGYDDGEDDDEEDGENPSGQARTPEEAGKIALHEAGHLVVSEVIKKGSVGFATIRSNGRDTGGFIHNCAPLNGRREHILVALAGKAAVELYHSDACAGGCDGDIAKAVDLIRDGIENGGTHGLGAVDTSGRADWSQTYLTMVETLTRAELEQYLFKARDLLLKNRDFLEKTAGALLKKDVLLFSDIQKIRESVTVTPEVA